jgi:hypothetical protein
VDESIFLFMAYVGNILTAQKSERSGRYYLAVLGESDHGTSKFKMVLSAKALIAAGSYRNDSFDQRLESLYFTSNTKLWNGNTTRLYMENLFFPTNTPAYCTIEILNDNKLVACLGGKIYIVLGPSGVTSSTMRKGPLIATIN